MVTKFPQTEQPASLVASTTAGARDAPLKASDIITVSCFSKLYTAFKECHL